jgi:hypothetical protein
MASFKHFQFKHFFTALPLIYLSGINSFAAPSLRLNHDQLWQSMLKQMMIAKLSPTETNPETITLEKPDLRIDLTIHDLIDQVNEIILNEFNNTQYAQNLEDTLKSADGTINRIKNFEQWYQRLNLLAESDSKLRSLLDEHLVLQEYDSFGTALKDNISFYQLRRIHQIDHFNRIAQNPEAKGISKKLRIDFPLTVSTSADLSNHTIRKATRDFYREYEKEIAEINAAESFKCEASTKTKIEKLDADRIFDAIEKLPQKHYLLEAIDKRLNPKLPILQSGSRSLPKAYILCNEQKLIPILKDLTWEKYFDQEDDEIILEMRRWLKKNKSNCENCVTEKLSRFNQEHQTNLELPWLKRRGLPHRSEVIENFQILQAIYGSDEPWQDEIDTVLTNRRGKRVMIGYTRTGGAIRKAAEIIRQAVKYENLAGAAAGTSALLLSNGNIPLAITVNSLIKDTVSNRKYDHPAKELLTTIPIDLLQGALTLTGFQPGKFFNLLGLGAGYGLTQGIVTKQDPLKSALVGAAVEGGIGLLPVKIRNPMVNGIGHSALAKNAAIEIFTTSAKATLRGGLVAIIDKKDVVNGMKNGAIYGAGIASLKIIILGARYNPFTGHSDQEIQDALKNENDFDNANGAPGGNYNITTDTINDTPFRKDGLLPRFIEASITLPGSVSMKNSHSIRIKIIAHEAHHLSQQEQLGLIQFYVEYLLESLTTPYEQLSFEISPH